LVNNETEVNGFAILAVIADQLYRPQDPSIHTDAQHKAPIAYQISSTIPCHETSGPELPDSN